tara:strand:+ start:7107 stop:8210 length:1104 start_codon:yes stop_codon:yes gene_type:complete
MKHLTKLNLQDVDGLTGNGVRLLVIDTGIKFSLGTVDVIESMGINSSPNDTHGHGTMVANLIANNGTGIAPGVDLYIVDASDENNNFWQDDIATAIMRGIDWGVDIITMSISGKSLVNDTLRDAVQSAIDLDINVVAATGNSFPSGLASWPAFLPGVVGVGASNYEDERAPFSEGAPSLDIYAPGVDIEVMNLNGTTGVESGTSLSTPMIAATMALMIEAGKDPDDIFNYVLPVIGETKGQINAGFATHTTGDALLHHWQIFEDLTVSYLLPEQTVEFDVIIFIEHEDLVYNVTATGEIVLSDIKEVAFNDLPSNTELIGNLFGYNGVYDYLDVTGIDPGEYIFNVELVDNNGVQLQVIGQEVIEII